jgi:hypothetical protein
MQAYDAIVGGEATAESALPSACAELRIDWARFDGFAQAAGDIWRDFVRYLLDSAALHPQLAEVPMPSRERLESLLGGRLTALLSEQRGLVVDIARAAGQHSPRARPVASPSRPSPSERQAEIAGLAASILAWLRRAAEAHVAAHGAAIERDLRVWLAAYAAYEAKLLAALNEHVCRAMQALDLPFGAPLSAGAISKVCGRTIGDWDLVAE